MADEAGGSPAGHRADARRNRARILAAAEQVFSECGAAGSTEEIARQAGVSVGTVFRHFPTKQDLLTAIVKDLLLRLRQAADELVDRGDPTTALFRFFSLLVMQAAEKKTVVELLASAGTVVPAHAVVAGFTGTVSILLEHAQSAGAVRSDVTAEDVVALLISMTQGAVRGGWRRQRQRRVLSIVFDGLTVAAQRPS